ncbi:MAG: YkgJ family cysteine cluster protein [Thermoguttaceae bacterium]
MGDRRLDPPHCCPGSQRPQRGRLPPGEVLCGYCTAKCCRYFALPLDTPATWREFDYLRWFLLHDRAAVFVEEDTWYLLVHTPCKHLRDDHRCEIYDRRPRICREYTTAKCEYEEDWVYDHYWETAEQVEEYAEAVLGPRPGQGFRSPRPGHRSGTKAHPR